MSALSGKIYRQKNPWYESWRCAWRRCNDPNHKAAPWYYYKGIKFLLTKEECLELWVRDQGWLLEKPVLDRIKPDKNYCFDNCRFIEHKHNVALAHGRDCTEWSE